MSYFRELPDLEYKSFLPTSNTSNDYILTKNLFRRGKLRDDLAKVFTIFNKYQIKDNSRPDLVAEELYGQADLDWVVITSAGIINIRDQWPLSDRDVYELIPIKFLPKVSGGRRRKQKGRGLGLSKTKKIHNSPFIVHTLTGKKKNIEKQKKSMKKAKKLLGVN
jgi:hypothetical protein